MVKEKNYHVTTGLWGGRIIVENRGEFCALLVGEPKDIAYGILNDYMGTEPSKTYIQGFVDDFVDPLIRLFTGVIPKGLVIPGDAIAEWLEER